MHHLRPALVLAAFLVPAMAVAPAQAATGNARAPDLVAGATVLDVALSDTGYILATTDDPGSTVQGNGSLATWFLWDPAGNLLRSGHGDHPGCSGMSVRPPDVCRSPTVAGAVSRDGRRFVAASRVAAAAVPADTARGILVGGTSSLGETFRVAVDYSPVAAALSADGATLAVVGTRAPIGGTAHGVLRIYAWGGDTALQSVSNATLGLPVSDVAIATDGSFAVAGADKAYRLTRTGALSTVGSIQGNVTAVAATDVAPGLAVAVTAVGDFGTTNGNLTANLRHYPRTFASVAASSDGTAFYLGDSAGAVIRLRPVAAGLAQDIVVVGPTSAAVHALALSRDGRTLAASVGNEVVQVHTVGTMAVLWRDTTGQKSAIATDVLGDRVAASKGTTVRLEQALHRVTLSPGAIDLPRKGSTTVDLTLRNAGNRLEAGPLSVQVPSGWNVSLSAANFTLLPDKSVTFQATFGPPPGLPPATYPVRSTAGAFPLLLNATMPRVVDVVLEPIGASSLGMAAGDSAAFRAKFTNHGNTVGTGRIQLIVRPVGWIGKTVPESLTLAPGDSRDVEVFLTAPSTGAMGAQGDVTLSYQGGSTKFTGTIGARFDAQLEGPAGMELSPGNSTTGTFTVRNTGNAPDTITLAIRDTTIPQGWQVAWNNGQGRIELRDIPAGGSASASMTVWPPLDAPLGGIVDMAILATSLADPTYAQNHVVTLTVLKPGVTTTPPAESEGTPGPGALVIAGLAALGLLVRRRRGA